MSTSKKQILAVDDDIDILEQVAFELRRDGYEVITAESEAAAKEALAAATPDLAIFDLMMENMDSGLVLCHRVKQATPQVPVIILTAVTADTGLDFDVTTATEQSWVKADKIMDKPVRGEQLRETVKSLLEG